MTQYFTRTIVAGNDFSSPTHLGKALTLSGDFANNGREAMGLLLIGASSGRHVTIGVMGILPYASVDITSAGGALTVTDSGFLTNLAVSNYEVGMSYGEKGTNQIAVNSGAVGDGNFNFAVKHYTAPLSGGVFI